MAETKEVVAEIEKNRANITKLGKSQTGDKDKAAALKDLEGILREAKGFQKTKDDLDKCIKELAKLDDDIKDYNTGYNAMFKDARTLADKFNKFTPDTKEKDFSKIAVALLKLGDTARPEKK